MSSPRRASTRHVSVAFGVSLVASVVLAATWLTGGHTQIEGLSLAVAAGGIGVGLVRWAKHHTPQGPHVEEHESPDPGSREREELVEDVDPDQVLLSRRSVGGLLAGALTTLALAALVPLRWIALRPTTDLIQTPWRPGVRLVLQDGTPVHVDDLAPGGVAVVFPEGHTDIQDAQTVLLRPRTGAQIAEAQGHIAYSRLCTHAGCPVGLYEEESNLIYCPCHQSVFDILDQARPVAGPATRPLPRLRITTDGEGYLRALGDFDSPPGPGFWEMPT